MFAHWVATVALVQAVAPVLLALQLTHWPKAVLAKPLAHAVHLSFSAQVLQLVTSHRAGGAGPISVGGKRGDPGWF